MRHKLIGTWVINDSYIQKKSYAKKQNKVIGTSVGVNLWVKQTHSERSTHETFLNEKKNKMKKVQVKKCKRKSASEKANVKKNYECKKVPVIKIVSEKIYSWKRKLMWK